jgi:hypothetical protein
MKHKPHSPYRDSNAAANYQHTRRKRNNKGAYTAAHFLTSHLPFASPNILRFMC